LKKNFIALTRSLKWVGPRSPVIGLVQNVITFCPRYGTFNYHYKINLIISDKFCIYVVGFY